MPIVHSKYFPESALAHELLDGLRCMEIGGAIHNTFGLDTVNVDRLHHTDPAFRLNYDEQMRLCGEVMPVDIVAPGDCIPVPDKSFDAVVSSHAIEHFYDPVSTIREWMRIATQYVFIICPLRDALESDRDKPLTPLEEHIARFHANDKDKEYPDDHHSRWTSESFVQMCEWIFTQDFGHGWQVCAVEDPDKKVGNGFCVVLQYVPEEERITPAGNSKGGNSLLGILWSFLTRPSK